MDLKSRNIHLSERVYSNIDPKTRERLTGRRAPKQRQFYLLVFFTLAVCFFFTGVLLLQFWPRASEEQEGVEKRDVEYPKEIVITAGSILAQPRNEDCTFHTCFDVYHCGYNDDNRISVYIYPSVEYTDEDGMPVSLPLSKEYHEILETVMDSIYYTTDPDKACLFLPPIDLLNQNNIRLKETSKILATLPRWNEGINHLLFNMLPGSTPDYNTTLDVNHDHAILAGGGFSTWSYRYGYDVSIPIYNPLTVNSRLNEYSRGDRRWLLISSQFGMHSEYYEELALLAKHHSGFLLLDKCEEGNLTQRCHATSGETYSYPDILQDSTFCLIIRGARLGQTALFDAMMAGCIPVIVADGYVPPYEEVIDWKRASVVLREEILPQIITTLSKITKGHVDSLRQQARFIWETYFSSMRAITMTTLQIINDRVFPYAAKKYDEWNETPARPAVMNPLFLPVHPSRTMGFTAVILTYDRLEYLFRVIQRVAQVPSLTKVLVVWNNQQKAPPQASVWPKISKPLKVVQTRQNKLSNRFYPYDEIETEAILALDDDIIMLTPDEIEFGYEVWREFPDRLVGFPSRLHLWDNATNRWRYESEWTSQISIVLTGAAFHHKYYSYLYTNSMPGNIKAWVDDHMNCEDIAMNFLISNLTGKPAIKVAPRQKFKCPECQNYGLSADLVHMVERSECVNKFAEIYGCMPLKTVEFRADPVLYKDNFPEKLKRYNEIGSL